MPHGTVSVVLAALSTSKSGGMSQLFLLGVKNQEPKYTRYVL